LEDQDIGKTLPLMNMDDTGRENGPTGKPSPIDTLTAEAYANLCPRKNRAWTGPTWDDYVDETLRSLRHLGMTEGAGQFVAASRSHLDEELTLHRIQL
jgi:hypothetical protein